MELQHMVTVSTQKSKKNNLRTRSVKEIQMDGNKNSSSLKQTIFTS